jgi:transcriptional regulator with XRE-family HTH domain
MDKAELRRLIEKAGISQREAAEKIGVTKAAVEHWLAGRRPVPKYAVTIMRTVAM